MRAGGGGRLGADAQVGGAGIVDSSAQRWTYLTRQAPLANQHTRPASLHRPALTCRKLLYLMYSCFYGSEYTPISVAAHAGSVNRIAAISSYRERANYASERSLTYRSQGNSCNAIQRATHNTRMSPIGRSPSYSTSPVSTGRDNIVA